LINKCDCCEYFGEESGPNVQLCKLCGKYLCDGCRWSKKRGEYFLKYWTKGRLPELKKVIDGLSKLPKHLSKWSDCGLS
jgi:hypothetical protein